MNVIGVTQFASTEAASGGVFGALGINFTLLIFQIVAFLLLVWLLSKFVYPVFVRIIEEREAKIEASVNAAKEAEAKAQDSQKEIAALLKQARAEAADIVTTAKDEASKLAADSDEKARARAEQIVKTAHGELEKEIAAAKKMLHNETIELVASATEAIIGKKLTKDIDNKEIASALKEAK
jgi:F-type H+-transporting ATPase subunit b